MRKLLVASVLVGAVALAVVALAAADSTYRGIEPVVVSGKDLRGKVFDCATYGATKSVKFDPPVNGASADGITLLVPGPGAPGTITWYSDYTVSVVKAAFVKGGQDANAYIYHPETPPADYSDTGLHAPFKDNPKRGFHEAGYIMFCYNPA